MRDECPPFVNQRLTAVVLAQLISALAASGKMHTAPAGNALPVVHCTPACEPDGDAVAIHTRIRNATGSTMVHDVIRLDLMYNSLLAG